MPGFQSVERKIRMFNIIVEHVMPHLDQLKKIDDNSGTVTADAISESLDKLSSLLFMPNIVNDWCGESDASSNSLSTIDEMLDAKLCIYEEGYTPAQEDAMFAYQYVPGGHEATGFSLREKLASSRFPELLKTVERTLACLDIESLLNINPSVHDVINKSTYSTSTNASALCKLASTGSFAEINKLTFSSHHINKLVQNAVLGDPPSFLGNYNALMIAAAYRHVAVVRYFVEVKHADLSIKGGRLRNYTALDCAKKVWWFAPKPNLDLINYLSSKQPATSTRRNSFFISDICDDSSKNTTGRDESQRCVIA